MDVKLGQRFKFKGSGRGFIAEVIRVRSAQSHDVKVVQDLGWGRAPGYIYECEDVTHAGSWEYLPGQDAPNV